MKLPHSFYLDSNLPKVISLQAAIEERSQGSIIEAALMLYLLSRIAHGLPVSQAAMEALASSPNQKILK